LAPPCSAPQFSELEELDESSEVVVEQLDDFELEDERQTGREVELEVSFRDRLTTEDGETGSSTEGASITRTRDEPPTNFCWQQWP